jgi:hypothetical protein
MERENFKNIEISGRKWRIEKFDALTACYLAYQLMAQAMPMGLGKQIPGMPANDGAKIMSEVEFKALIKKCLGVCYEILPARNAPVINPNGSWGVLGVENDPVLVIGLLIHAITFNVQGFFDGGALTELKASLADIKLFNASTSTNSSTPQ